VTLERRWIEHSELMFRYPSGIELHSTWCTREPVVCWLKRVGRRALVKLRGLVFMPRKDTPTNGLEAMAYRDGGLTLDTLVEEITRQVNMRLAIGGQSPSSIYIGRNQAQSIGRHPQVKVVNGGRFQIHGLPVYGMPMSGVIVV
jgi:hypothetical protein